MTTLWQNGKFIENGPLFLPTDRIRIGDGVFDTMLAVDGKLIHAKEHMARLQRHAAVFKIDLPYKNAELIEAASSLLSRNKFTTGRYVINTIITRGPAERGLRVPDNAAIQSVVMAAPAPTEFPPLQAMISKTVRRNEGSPLSGVKSCNYGDSILALLEAKEADANEAILLNNQGHLACASASNIFILKDRKLFTPPLKDGALDGVIRAKLIKKTKATEKTLTMDDLLSCNGVYLTNSVRGVIPVERLEGKTILQGSLEIDKDFHLL